MSPQRSVIVAALIRSGSDLSPCYALPGSVAGTAYSPGKWSAHQVLVHLADAETVFLDRLRRLAADQHPLLWAYDENRWAAELAYAQRDLACAGRLFSATRDAVIDLITVLPEDVLERTGVHSEAGTKSFAQVADTLVSHTRHHFEQVRAVADGHVWSASM